MSQSDTIARPRSLWHDRNFLTLWGGQAMSQFGAQIFELALPVLAVLLLQATEAEVGYLNAAAMAAFLIVGLPAGAWIDRMRKRHVMIWADGVRALTLAAVPLLHVFGHLEMWHLWIVALIVGVATVFFDVSYQSIVPSLVRGDQIAEANGKLESTQQLAGLDRSGDRRVARRHRLRPSRGRRHRPHLPRLAHGAGVHPRQRAAAGPRRPRAAAPRDRRRAALGVRQHPAASHRRRRRRSRTSSAPSCSR